VRFDVDGLDAVVRDFTRDAVLAREASKVVVVEHARQAANRMKVTVPIGSTQRTLESISSDADATSEGTAVWAEAGPEWFVARFINDGTAKMPPRPFVDQALADQAPKFERAMRAVPGL
jgi:HK97 gp10 family phage protein